MAQLKPFFRAALSADGALDITVYDEIGENVWTGGGVTANSVKQQLDNASNYSRIAMRINSPGGDAFEGMAIHSLLRAQGKPVDVFVDGIAASAASIIAMAGDTVTMASGAMMMIHDAWSMCVGNDEDMRKMADTLEKVSASIAQVYSDRTGKTVAEISALMDEETWMSADEAVAGGFADNISGRGDDSAMALASSFKSLAKLKNVPEALKLRNDDMDEDGDIDCTCPCAPCMDGDCQNCSHDPCDCIGCTCPNHIEDNLPVEIKQESDLSLYEASLSLLKHRL